jgi:hypothetical protein
MSRSKLKRRLDRFVRGMSSYNHVVPIYSAATPFPPLVRCRIGGNLQVKPPDGRLIGGKRVTSR